MDDLPELQGPDSGPNGQTSTPPAIPSPGQFIHVSDYRGPIDSGVVDAVTEDGSIVWLRQEGTKPRRLIEVLPHTTLTAGPAPDETKQCLCTTKGRR